MKNQIITRNQNKKWICLFSFSLSFSLSLLFRSIFSLVPILSFLVILSLSFSVSFSFLLEYRRPMPSFSTQKNSQCEKKWTKYKFNNKLNEKQTVTNKFIKIISKRNKKKNHTFSTNSPTFMTNALFKKYRNHPHPPINKHTPFGRPSQKSPTQQQSDNSIANTHTYQQ